MCHPFNVRSLIVPCRAPAFSRCRIATLARGGFTLIELLVVMAIIGVLVAMLLPAVQQSREAMRSIQCRNNLKQIALAVHNFHDAYQAFPPASLKTRPGDPPEYICGGNEPTWLVRVLPYLERSTQYASWDLYQSFAMHPEDVRNQAVPVYFCPSRRGADGAVAPEQSVSFTLPCGCQFTFPFPGGATSDYAANLGDPSPGMTGADTDFYWGGNGTGVLIVSRPKCSNWLSVGWADRIAMRDVTDGTSHTALVGELHVPHGRLNEMPFNGPAYSGNHFAAFSRIAGPGFPLMRPDRTEEVASFSFGSWHHDVANFALTDGSVRSVSYHINTSLLGRFSRRDDGVPTGEL